MQKRVKLVNEVVCTITVIREGEKWQSIIEQLNQHLKNSSHTRDVVNKYKSNKNNLFINDGGLSMNIEMEFYYTWFENYLGKYLDHKDPKIRINYELKREHTFRVRDNILKIGESLNLDENNLKLCEIIGLFHDVGRFKQYSDYGTFSDLITGSHGKISVDVLIGHNVLKNLKECEKDIVLKSIDYHNYFCVPEDESENIKFFSRIIRDADKLDAFYLETDRDENRKYDLEELSCEKEYSEEVIRDIIESRQVDFINIKYKYDRKLAILGFIFDLFYSQSYEVFQLGDYLIKMFRELPQNNEMSMIYTHCKDYIEYKLNSI